MNTALVLQLAIVATQHAAELQQLLATALAENRDLTDAEVAAARDKSQASIDALIAQNNAAKAAQGGQP